MYVALYILSLFVQAITMYKHLGSALRLILMYIFYTVLSRGGFWWHYYWLFVILPLAISPLPFPSFSLLPRHPVRGALRDFQPCGVGIKFVFVQYERPCPIDLSTAIIISYFPYPFFFN